MVTAFRGTEQLSRLFSFELDLIAENSTLVDFSKLVGNDISLRVATPGKGEAMGWRYISGICARFTQGNRNEEFTAYYAEVVPKVWLLTRRAQRIFQQKSVPDILGEVLQASLALLLDALRAARVKVIAFDRRSDPVLADFAKQRDDVSILEFDLSPDVIEQAVKDKLAAFSCTPSAAHAVPYHAGGICHGSEGI